MIDPARRSLEQAGANWHLRVAGIEALLYPDSSFDIVMTNHMLYHASNIRAGVRELAGVVKPNGCLCGTCSSSVTTEAALARSGRRAGPTYTVS
jgi:ubiquinone/menaquinone biosynthesis C-methylase UbiE